MNDDFYNFLVATDQLDEFLGLKDEALDKEIKETEDYMKKAEENMNILITENYYKKLLLKRIIIGGINGIIVFIIVYIIMNI